VDLNKLKRISQQLDIVGASHEAQWIAHLCDDEVNQIIKRRIKGEPLAYILGQWDFADLNFKVGPGVLIPRPETEELVYHKYFDEFIKKNNFKQINVVDFGAGSGCLGIALVNRLARKFPNTQFHLTLVEKSQEAVKFLEKNINLLKIIKNVTTHLISSDWTHFKSELKFHILISNPPYISPNEKESLSEDVLSFEPHEALFSKDLKHNDGLKDISNLISIFKKYCENKNICAFEYGLQNKKLINDLFLSHEIQNVKIEKDICNKERFLFFRI